jgi:hypothetical protein
MPPSTPPDDPQQSPMSLKDYASGVGNINLNLQRQTDAYSHFQTVIAQLTTITSNPDDEQQRLTRRLPFLVVKFPAPGGERPEEAKLDLNTMSAEQLKDLLPVFVMFEADAGRALLSAWEQLQSITTTTTPVVAAARAQLGAK